MKQFIDKLIERLEEESKDAQENMVKSTSNSVANFCSGACGAYNKTIAIVNQLAEEYNNDYILVHTQGLDVGIQCAMCTNPMKSDRGCDGGCSVNEEMYKKVLDVIERHTHDAPYQPKGE